MSNVRKEKEKAGTLIITEVSIKALTLRVILIRSFLMLLVYGASF